MGSLVQHFLQRGLHGIGPELVAFFVRVEEIGHDLGGHFAVRRKEDFVDIEKLNVFAIIVFGDEFVDPGIGFELLGGVVGFVARENSQEQDLCLGTFRAGFIDNEFDGIGDGLGLVAVAVVGPDHQDHDFGLDAVEFAVFDSPQDVLGAVATDPEVGGMTRFIGFVPNVFSFCAPTVSDGIAHEQEVDSAVLGLFDEPFMAGHPVGGVAPGCGNGGSIRRRRVCSLR